MLFYPMCMSVSHDCLGVRSRLIKMLATERSVSKNWGSQTRLSGRDASNRTGCTYAILLECQPRDKVSQDSCQYSEEATEYPGEVVLKVGYVLLKYQKHPGQKFLPPATSSPKTSWKRTKSSSPPVQASVAVNC